MARLFDRVIKPAVAGTISFIVPLELGFLAAQMIAGSDDQESADQQSLTKQKSSASFVIQATLLSVLGLGGIVLYFAGDD